MIFADSFEIQVLFQPGHLPLPMEEIKRQLPPPLWLGTKRLRALINNTTSIYVTDDRPISETRYRARFYFDPNSITMSNGNAHYIFYGYTGTSTDVLRIELRRSSGPLSIAGGVAQ